MATLAQKLSTAALGIGLLSGCGKAPQRDLAPDTTVTPGRNLNEFQLPSPVPEPVVTLEGATLALREPPEKFATVTNLIEYFKKGALENGATEPKVFLRDPKKVVVISPESHSDDIELEQALRATFLYKRFDLNLAMTEGYVGKKDSAAEQELAAFKNRILNVGAEATNNSGSQLVLLEDNFLKMLPPELEVTGIETTNSARLIAVANIIGMGMVELERAANIKLEGGPNQFFGTATAPEAFITQILVAQKELGSETNYPVFKIDSLKVAGLGDKLAITDANAAEVVKLCSKYAQWHFDATVKRRDRDLAPAVKAILEKRPTDQEVRAFMRIGTLHMDGTGSPILKALEDLNYTVIITE